MKYGRVLNSKQRVGNGEKARYSSEIYTAHYILYIEVSTKFFTIVDIDERKKGYFNTSQAGDKRISFFFTPSLIDLFAFHYSYTLFGKKERKREGEKMCTKAWKFDFLYLG